jgi:23S rRNA pseudouridine2605 synthase
MSTKAAEKIVEALTQLVEGFAELQEQLEAEYGPEAEDDAGEEEETSDLEDALVTEVRAAVESVIENEDCAPEDLASIISALTGALEEIAPEVFAEGTQEVGEDEEDEDIDLDDDDYDEDDEDEEDEEDEADAEEEEDDD